MNRPDDPPTNALSPRPDANDADERLTALELKIMDVEHTVETLDAVIRRQARDIESLRAERARLEARIESLAEGLGGAADADASAAGVPSADDELPPHY